MLGIDIASKIKFIPMSNNSIKMRIDEMSDNVLNQLCAELRNKDFSPQLDETTLSTNGAFLMAYVRYINDNNEIRKEFLFGEELRLDTKGLSIFECVKTFFNRANIPITNIIACATDGAPSMCGRYQGFKAYLKAEIKNLFPVHCVVHRQHLAAKYLDKKLNSFLQLVIRTVNYIKSSALNTRLFRNLCGNNNEEYKNLLFNTEVRWLSKGSCFLRFIQLLDSVTEYLITNANSN